MWQGGGYLLNQVNSAKSLPPSILSLLASLEPNSGSLGSANTEKQCKKQIAHTFQFVLNYLTYSSKLEYKWNYQKSKKKGLRRIPGCWWDVAQWSSMFLACLCPWVQSSEPPSPPNPHILENNKSFIP